MSSCRKSKLPLLFSLKARRLGDAAQARSGDLAVFALEYRQADLDVEVGAEAIEFLAAPGFRRRIRQRERGRQRCSRARYFVQKSLDVLTRDRARTIGEQQACGKLLPRSASRAFDRLPGQIAAAPAEPAAGLGESGGKRIGQRIAAHRPLRLEMHDALDVRVGRRAGALGARRGQDVGQRLAERLGGHRRQIVGFLAVSIAALDAAVWPVRNCGSTRSRSSSTSAG